MPKIVDHDAEREQLLDASFQVFAVEGYAQATMRKLAKAAGVSTGKLYHYFPDKRAILGALFAHATARDEARVRNTLPAGASVEDRVVALFAFYRGNVSYLADLIRLALEVHRHDPAPESRAQVQEALRRYRSAMADILGVDGLLAQMAFSLLLGNLVQEVMDPDAVDLAGQEAYVLGVWQAMGSGPAR